MQLDKRPAELRLTACELEAILLEQCSTRAESSQLLHTYLVEWRPLMIHGPSPFLFPAEGPDRHKGKNTLSAQIKELVVSFRGLFACT